jgi:hypothetical protein
MTMDQLLAHAPTVIQELTTELVRRGDACMKAAETSPLTACFFLALRSVSLLSGLEVLLKPLTRDSYDALARSFLESRDLLMTFRFDDQGTRNRIHAWFKSSGDGAWKAYHKTCEKFINRLGGGPTEFGERWSMFSALSHPTVHAARHSVSMAVSRLSGQFRFEDINTTMTFKTADYLESIATLIAATTFDLPGWISLGCDMDRMPNVEPFRVQVVEVASPIVRLNKDVKLPDERYCPKSNG